MKSNYFLSHRNEEKEFSHQNSDEVGLVSKEVAVVVVIAVAEAIVEASGRESFNLIGCFLPTSSSYLLKNELRHVFSRPGSIDKVPF